MINDFPQSFLAPQTPLVANDLTLNKDGRYLLLALFNRTGGASGLPSVKTGIASAGSSQPSATLLGADWNFVSTVPGGSGVIIPQLVIGADCLVFNDGGANLNVYPFSGYSIDALSVNAPYVLAPNKMQWFRCESSKLIRSTQLG